MRHLNLGIILAAGASSRMRRPKALLRDPSGATWLARVAQSLRRGGCQAVVVVAGKHAREIAALLPEGALLLVNSDWRRGQLSSAQTGLQAAAALGAQRVVMHPVDQPLLRPSDVRAVLAAARGRRLAIASFEGEPGHPVAMTGEVAARVVSDRSSQTLRESLAKGSSGRTLVPASQGCLLGANTPAEARGLFTGRR